MLLKDILFSSIKSLLTGHYFLISITLLIMLVSVYFHTCTTFDYIDHYVYTGFSFCSLLQATVHHLVYYRPNTFIPNKIRPLRCMQFQQLSISFYVNLYGNPQNCPATLCITLKPAWKKNDLDRNCCSQWNLSARFTLKRWRKVACTSNSNQWNCLPRSMCTSPLQFPDLSYKARTQTILRTAFLECSRFNATWAGKLQFHQIISHA